MGERLLRYITQLHRRSSTSTYTFRRFDIRSMLSRSISSDTGSPFMTMRRSDINCSRFNRILTCSDRAKLPVFLATPHQLSTLISKQVLSFPVYTLRRAAAEIVQIDHSPSRRWCYRYSIGSNCTVGAFAEFECITYIEWNLDIPQQGPVVLKET